MNSSRKSHVTGSQPAAAQTAAWISPTSSLASPPNHQIHLLYSTILPSPLFSTKSERLLRLSGGGEILTRCIILSC